MDTAPLIQSIVLLHIINETPQDPCENKLQLTSACSDDSSERLLDIRHEKDLVEAFAFLASTTNDPRKVIAVCVEESKRDRRLVVRTAANHGSLVTVQRGLQGLADIVERVAREGQLAILIESADLRLLHLTELESSDETRETLFSRVVALNQNRILARLRSKHATLKCNYKKDQLLKPKILLQLREAMGKVEEAACPASMSSDCRTLSLDVEKLRDLFLTLEGMTTREARSEAGLRVLLQIIKISHRIHSRRTLRAALDSTLTLVPDSKTKVLTTMTKLSRYWTVSKFLLGAARKYPLFDRVEISTVHLNAHLPPAKESDFLTTQLIERVCGDKRWEQTLSRMRLKSESQVRAYVSRKASSDCPVHAEVQLLFHYERGDCKLRPRVIGSSKKACFLCSLLFTLHGGYVTPATHGRIYPKWGLPRMDDHNFSTARMRTILGEFINAVQRTLQYEMHSVRKPMPPPCESAIFPSAACSYTNQSDSANSCCTGEVVVLDSPTEVRMSPQPSPPMPGSKVDVIRMVDIDTTDPRQRLSRSSLEASGSRPSSTMCCLLHSQMEISSGQHAALFPDVVSVVSTADSLPAYMERGKGIWSQLHSTAQTTTVSTPKMQLTLAYDNYLTSALPAAHTTQYWIGLEWLDGEPVNLNDDIDLADVGDLEIGSQMTVDLGKATWPRVLHIRSGDDIVALTYGLARSLPNMPYIE